jgi:hypothetical protein
MTDPARPLSVRKQDTLRRLEDDVGDQDALVAQVKALAVVSGGEGYVTRQGSASMMVTSTPKDFHALANSQPITPPPSTVKERGR